LTFHSGREANHSPPSSAEVKEWVELYLPSPNTPSWRGAQLGGAHLYHARSTLHPSYTPWFDHSTNIWWKVKIMKLLIVQFSSSSCFFLTLISKYSSPYKFLKMAT
jgi:hypothetical protein